MAWRYPGLLGHEPPDESVVTETTEIMQMWFVLEMTYGAMSPADKARVEKEAEPFGKDVRFRGFDGNNEGAHLAVARFLVDQLGRFDDFKGRDLNAHMLSLDSYRRMLPAYRGAVQGKITGGITPDDVIKVLNARTHPDFKK